MLALALDITIVALLLISLGAGIRLYGALKVFRVDSNEFQPMITSLDRATARAESALSSLRRAAQDVGAKLNDETKTSQRLLDELNFMTQRADQLAEKLEQHISKARSASPPPMAKPVAGETLRSSDTDGSPLSMRRREPNLEQRLNSLR